ncbi:MAG: hypothetical protein AAGF12_02085 [Myxococcota bacterium]
MRWCVSALIIGAVGCGADSFPWEVALGDEFRDATRAVEASVTIGGCTTDGPIAYRAFLTRGGAVNAPGDLGTGTFGFRARAYDVDCNLIGEGCVEADVPTAAVRVVAAATTPSAACAGGQCNDGVCTPGAENGCAEEGCIGVVRQVAAGRNHTCAINGVDEVWCWGRNVEGQLGIGTNQDHSVPRRVQLSDVRAVSVGGPLAGTHGHTCAVTGDGTLYCWGDNRDRQLGVDGDGSNLPVSVRSGVIGVSAGGSHSCALLADGTLLCFGSNDAGQLNGFPDDGMVPRVPEVSPALVFVAAADAHTCAIGDGTTALCWGSNSDGRLGRAVAGQSEGTRGVLNANLVQRLAVGAMHSCIVNGDGGVRCWGSNEDGQLGNPGARQGRATPVEALDGIAVGALAAGGAHSCAVGGAGALSCWGSNRSGQLGVGDGVLGADMPTEVLFSNATSVVAGAEHTCALDEDGGLFCWGLNRYGQLGTGDMNEAFTPSPVLGSGP